ncbi:MAG: dihydroneopterin aldolase [Fimbriimonadales bacterium]|nr:dihydroneopterin aldolase [Fimbriimonadales bacterium]
MVRVRVLGLEFFGRHGVADCERETGHRFRADLDAEVDPAVLDRDELEGTVDYSELARLAVRVSDELPCRTIEALAGRIGRAALERFPAVRSLRVRVRKVHPPFEAIVEATEVEAEFRR